MASIAKILPHLEKGDRSPDSSDNGFDSFGSGSASSPERNHLDSDHFIQATKATSQNNCEHTSGSDSGRVSSPESPCIIDNGTVKANNFRPWETESKGIAEARVPELGLHHANNFTFGMQNFRLPFMQGMAPNSFPAQFNPFTPAQINNQQYTIQQFLQQSNLAQNYVSHQKAYAALRIKSEFESLQSNAQTFDNKQVRHQDNCMTVRPWTSPESSEVDVKTQLKNTPRIKKKENGNKPYKCPICEAQFNRPANLKTHLRIHSGEKPYKCDTCGARFVQVAHLRAHVLIHTGEKPYPCQICGTRFRHLQTLKSHIRIHTGEKPFSCDECSLRFRHKSQLRLHLRTKHGINTNTKKSYTFVPGLNSADLSKMIKENSKQNDEQLTITEVTAQ